MEQANALVQVKDFESIRNALCERLGDEQRAQILDDHDLEEFTTVIQKRMCLTIPN